MALQLHSIRGGVLLIDEVETAIHKDALGRVFRWLINACRAFNVQLFVTTHSLEAIDALLSAVEGHEDDISAYRLPAKASNEVLARYSGKSLSKLRLHGGMEVR
jgi:AAA15 family ATPase/GTPase